MFFYLLFSPALPSHPLSPHRPPKILKHARNTQKRKKRKKKQLTRALEKAAYDPRIKAVYLRIDPLAAGWAKLQEISEYVELFNASGKPSIAFLTRGGEKEYYLASACSKVYIAPTASLSLRGVGVAGSFLMGVFEKLGVTPEVRRIGDYKR